jgi:hypothetical protein
MIVQRATLHPHSQGTARAPGAEMLSSTEVLKYGNTAQRLEVLRTKIRATGVKSIARGSGVSRSRLQPNRPGRTQYVDSGRGMAITGLVLGMLTVIWKLILGLNLILDGCSARFNTVGNRETTYNSAL